MAEAASSGREALLHEYQEVRQKEGNLDGRMLLLVFITLLLVLALCVPKIYLRNQIYYSSRTIQGLEIQYDLLIEENKKLRQQLEDIKFRNLVMEMAY